MLVKLGARSDSLDVIDLLLDCHAKIRRFLWIARAMAAGTSSDEKRAIVTAMRERRTVR